MTRRKCIICIRVPRLFPVCSLQEDFLSHAALADKHFTAERGAPTFVSSSYGAAEAMPAVAAAAAAAGGTTVLRWLRIPRRPRWEATMSAAELHKAENDAFLKWRRDVAVQEAEIQGAAGGTALAFSGGTSIGSTSGAAGASVTPFEKNLAIWQQLWRVVERAHVLVQIVDARDPLFYYCPDVDAYAREVHPDKGTLLLVNKADFLTPRQRAAWAAYFEGQGVACAFFSAKAELEAMEAEDAARRAAMGAGMGLGSFEEAAAALTGAAGDDGSVGGSSSGHGGAASASVADAAAAAGKGRRRKGKKLTGSKSRFSALALDDDSSSDEKDGARKASSAGKAAAADADAVDSDEEEDEDEDEGEAEEHGAASVAGGAGAHATSAANAPSAAAAAPGTVVADAQPSDPSIPPVLNRDQLVDFMNERFGHLAKSRGVGGKSGSSANPASLAKLKELRASQRAAAVAARAEEMRRRAALAEKMIHAGLGAQVRFGDIGDVAGSGAAASAAGDGAAGAGAGDDDEAFDDAFDEAAFYDGSEAGGGDGRPPALMVGMVGYPNVGKSSTINALLGATASAHSSYRVAVAATPGKTKHFQTLPLTDTLTLVDCPGLVFPSFVSTREEMVCNGVLPIDQLRDYAAPIRLVCARVARGVFEGAYGIKLPAPEPPQDPRRQPTPLELLDSFCTARGLMGATHAGCDHPRGSRILLRDYTEGRLLYAHPPPGGWVKWVPAGLSDSADGLEPALGPAAPAPAADASGGAGAAAKASSGKKGVSRWENVLVPAGGARAAAASSAAAARAAPAAGAADSDSDDDEDDDDEEEASPEELAELAAAMEESAAMAKGQAGSSTSTSSAKAKGKGMDDATLRSFSRVVYLAGDSDTDENEAEDGDDEEEEEEAPAESAAAGSGSSARATAPPTLTAAPVPIKTKSREVAGGGAHIKGRSKVYLPLDGTAAAAAAGISAGAGAGAAAGGAGAGDGSDSEGGGAGPSTATGTHRIAPKRSMKKERRLRKGEKRIDDPYNTAGVADAAARRDHLAEVAAVNRAFQ